MRFTCEKNALVNALSIASRTVAQKSSLAAIEGILCQAGMHLQLTGYNLETAITVTTDADIAETGACVLPARLFFDIIRRLPEGRSMSALTASLRCRSGPDTPISPFRPPRRRIIQSCRTWTIPTASPFPRRN